VSRIEVAVDARTGVPLRTAVYAAGQRDAAFVAAYTSISFRVPKASTFDPPDAPLTAPSGTAKTPAAQQLSPTTTTVGSGWTAVTQLSGLRLAPAAAQQLAQVVTKVPQGELITTRLLSVLLTPAGTALVGAVPPAALEALAP